MGAKLSPAKPGGDGNQMVSQSVKADKILPAFSFTREYNEDLFNSETVEVNIHKLKREISIALKTFNGTDVKVWKDGRPGGEATSLGTSSSILQADIIAIQTYAEGMTQRGGPKC